MENEFDIEFKNYLYQVLGKDNLQELESNDEDGECYILKDVSGENDSEALFEFVEDDRELDGVMGIFEELLKDADVELEK